MFQLPSFFKIRMAALIIGFFILFWLIGFAKWCFASNSHTFSTDLTSTVVTGNVTNPHVWNILVFDCNAIWNKNVGWVNYSGTVNLSRRSTSAFHSYVYADGVLQTSNYNTFGSSYIAADAIIQFPDPCTCYPSDTLCQEQCSTQSKTDAETACLGAENLAHFDDVTCEGYCKTCEEIEPICEATCAPDQKALFDCSDNGLSHPPKLFTPLGGPLCQCLECSDLRDQWGIDNNCTNQGGLITAYDCPSNTGTCKTCDQQRKDWEAANCVGPGLYAANFNCSDKTVQDVPPRSGICSSCETRKEIFRQSHCGADQAVTNYDCDADTGDCTDCLAKQTAWQNQYCVGPGLEFRSYDCQTNTGVCDDCVTKKQAWENQYCVGPGLSTLDYNCEANTGTCRDCGLLKENYYQAHCKPVGKILVAYDCDVDSGICGDNTCAEDQATWQLEHCSGPGQTVVKFDCDTKEGVCRDENDCQSKETAWKTLHCDPLHLPLLSYDCPTDTGQCDDIYGCQSKEAAWKSKYCQGPGLTFKSYDCTADTGVCQDDQACGTAQARWKESFCSGEKDVFVSFDCSTGHGECTHGSDYKYTPTDEEKSLYTDRFNKFITDMRNTPLFGLPNQVLGNIPAGGDPVYVVEMGQYGKSDVDLSRYHSAFGIVRSVFLVCFSFAALRILISHR